jgi:hypothetical protein
MLPSWPLNLPLSANVDTAKAQAWRFYGRQEAQDHAEPMMGANRANARGRSDASWRARRAIRGRGLGSIRTESAFQVRMVA